MDEKKRRLKLCSDWEWFVVNKIKKMGVGGQMRVSWTQRWCTRSDTKTFCEPKSRRTRIFRPKLQSTLVLLEFYIYPTSHTWHPILVYSRMLYWRKRRKKAYKSESHESSFKTEARQIADFVNALFSQLFHRFFCFFRFFFIFGTKTL